MTSIQNHSIIKTMNWWGLVIDGVSKIPWERIVIRPKVRPMPQFSIPGTVTTEAAQKEIVTPQKPQEPPKNASIKSQVATACVPCALGHFSTSAGLLNEAVRFKKEGMRSNEILDRIGKVLEEQNALERVNLAPGEIASIRNKWERDIAEEALDQSRGLRHKLESIEGIDELEKVAADTAKYYKKLNRQWYKGRFAHAKDKVGAEDR